ncbi:MAG: FHA domain-containing protein [bacterium]
MIETKTGRRVPLPPRLLVGRTRHADLQLTGGWISGEHAVVWWDGRGWRVRDLGSRNGTTVDGRPIEARADHKLARGAQLAFGQREEAWALDDDAGPAPMAVRGDGTVLFGLDDVISLPDERAPEATVRHEGDRWVFDDERAPRAVDDCERVVVGGEVWLLRLPEVAEPTSEAIGGVHRLADLKLELAVAGHGEVVDARLLRAGHRIGLEPRSHHELLVLLARQYVEDADASPDDRGWIFPEVLMDTMRCTREVLNVYIHRIRRQFAAADVVDGHQVIERRAPTHEVRLAPLDVTVIDL